VASNSRHHSSVEVLVSPRSSDLRGLVATNRYASRSLSLRMRRKPRTERQAPRVHTVHRSRPQRVLPDTDPSTWWG